MAHSRYYKIFDTKDEVQSPYELARELSNGKFVAELNLEIGSIIGNEMSLEQVENYIRENHIHEVEN
jgi:hypothetical protein